MPVRGQTVEPVRTLPVPVFSPSVKYNKLQETYKTVKFNSPRIDNEIGGIEEGITLLFGAPNSGKTACCLTLAFSALEQGWQVKYIDADQGVHSKRVMQIYESRGKPFDESRLSNVFFKLKEWNWKCLKESWQNILVLEKPDLFIIDSITPIFLERIFGCADRERWDILQERDLLAIRSLRSCQDNHSIIIIVAHEKSPTTAESGKLQSDDIAFSGVGRRFAYLAKMWLYTMRVEKSNKVVHSLAILKHRYKEDFYKTRKLISFEIKNRGVI